MSGPIVRKYGFPNFEKIFGAKPLLHGQESEAEPGNVKVEKGEPDAAEREKSKAERKSGK